MAVTDPTGSNDPTDRRELVEPRFTAAITTFASLAWAALLIVVWSREDAAAETLLGRALPSILAYQVLWMIAVVVVAGGSLCLLLKRRWAHGLLLGVLSLMMIGALTHVVGALLWQDVTWWSDSLPMLVAVPVLVGTIACIVALVVGSAAKSRLRYGAVVIASVAVAVAIVVVVNLIAHRDYVRRSAETLGRFGPTERTKRVVESLDKDVRLTCAYTSTDPNRRGRDYGPRAVELLRDMAEYGRRRGKTIEVVNADDETKRAEIIAELHQRVETQAERHVAFLEGFSTESQRLEGELTVLAQQWQAADQADYLNQWALPSGMAMALQDAADQLETRRGAVTSERRHGVLPDYGQIVTDTRGTLRGTHDALAALTTVLRQIATVPEAVQGNRAEAERALQRCADRAKKMVDAVGAPDDPLPERPADTLRRAVREIRETAADAQRAADALNQLAGQDNAPILARNRMWQLQVPIGEGRVQRFPPDELFAQYGLILSREAEAMDQTVRAAKDAFLLQAIPGFRQQLAIVGGALIAADQTVRENMDALVTIDETSRALLTQADPDMPLVAMLDAIMVLTEAASALPELGDQTLSDEITQENIVLIDVEGRMEVVTFEEVWPLKTDSALRPADDEPPPRVFNGNAAISSRLLSMTCEPFATVVLTYFDPKIDPQLAQLLGDPEISAHHLKELKRQLAQANFDIEEWNLDDPAPWDIDDRSQPRVLVLLPPPEPLPFGGQEAPGRFSEVHLAKITEQIDAGTPAIFLTHFMKPRGFLGMNAQPAYAYGDYLRAAWGIDVRVDSTFVPVDPDPALPGRYRLNSDRLSYLPLSLFTDHPIGRPLRGQRMIWLELCPVVVDAPPAGVAADPLLVIPEGWNDTMWVTTNIMDLAARVQRHGGLIEPDFAGGVDVRIPERGFPVAVAASRSPAEEATTDTRPAADPEAAPQPVRIVVLSMGSSLADGYIDTEVPTWPGGTLVLSDPPEANGEVVVNSLYWLIGREGQIAASAAVSRPIQAVSAPLYRALWVACVLVVPLIVVGIGGAVMIVRRR